jgi:MoaA/NifB/PqqE/SkfB family radical SAM enzyme
LATSYYSDVPAEHDAITRRRGSHSRTLTNIKEAVTRNIALRVGIVETSNSKRTEHARAELEAVGVTSIGIDRTRRVGRAAVGSKPDASQLCGKCGNGCLAISPEGTVWPCVFSRWLPVGNVRKAPLADIVTGAPLAAAMTELGETFLSRRPCVPKMCDPQCGPSCSPTCNPQKCTPICRPQYVAEPCSPTRDCQPNRCRPSK